MDDAVLREQVAYYRARAPEYDGSAGGSAGPRSALADGAQLLQGMGPFERVLELACGTGIWTQRLLEIGREITALDAAPEMLEINARKVADERVRYRLADLFTWEPERRYDLVFAAFWLSHIPPDALAAFLAKVGRAVRPGGELVLVDQHAPTDEDRRIAKDGIYATRPLADGRTFTIVKVFYDPSELGDRLTGLGFAVTVHRLDDVFFFLSARLGERRVASTRR
jgi:ubiquinone/menaquinone biosynthesis C-methylase UbiE